MSPRRPAAVPRDPAHAELSRALRTGVPHDRSGRPLRTLAQVVADLPFWPADEPPPPGVDLFAHESLARAVERIDPDDGNLWLRVQHGDGSLSVLGVADFFRRMAGAFAHEALHDPLTGLPNRRSVLEQMRTRLTTASPDTPVSLLFLDLDRFKDINDRRGHDAGDAVLVEVAARLRDVLRRRDVLGRLAGDEFLVLLDGSDEPEAGDPDADDQRARQIEAVTRRIQEAVAEAGAAVPEVALSASVGYASFTEPVDVAEALRRADDAMYDAKGAGGGAVRAFDDSMGRSARRRTPDRAESVTEGSLRLDYQPVIRAGSPVVEEVEALLRWRDGRGHSVPPAEFVRYAEDLGLMGAVGQLVLDQACWQSASWRTAGVAVRVNVNLSAQQLGDSRLTEDVLSTLARHGLPAGALCLEVTEAVAAADGRRALSQLRELRSAGVRIALDDFGATRSSLAALRDIPVDVVKMDRSLMVTDLDSPRDRSLLRMVIETAHVLDLECVAEGVETWLQHDVLTDLGVDLLQGFLLGRPGPAASVTREVDLVGGRLR